MSYRSQRFSFAILVGIVLNLAFTFFIQIACWGPMISVMTRLTNPKEGTVIGAIVFLPSSVVLVIQTITRTDTVGEIGLLLTILAGFIGVGFGVGLGGLFGFLVGKIFDFQRTMS
jgi:hypothetical protein